MSSLRTRASSLRVPFFLAAGALAATVVACDDSTDGSGGASSSSSTTASSTVTGSTSNSSSSASNSSSSGAGGSVSEPTFVAHLDPTKGELAEGLFVKDQTAYVGLAALGKVVKVALPGGAVTDFGSIPTPPMNGGFLLGIVVDAANNAYVGFGGGPGTVVANGIYKIPAAGGAVTTPFATNAEMNFPNGLWLDASGAIFVADSGGAIFKVSSTDGTTTKWKSDPLLLGTDLTCANAAPFPIGANGIVRVGDTFFVANTNLGSIVKIPINGDGTAGTASLLAGPDCSTLGGIDGIDVGPDGTTIVAVVNSTNTIIQIDTNGDPNAGYGGKPLDNPASVDVVGSNAYITNSSFFNAVDPAPGLLVYPLD